MNNKGFTLIELLIVITIIAMLGVWIVEEVIKKDTHQKTDQIIEYKGN